MVRFVALLLALSPHSSKDLVSSGIVIVLSLACLN